jgi:hypothetical protein
MFKEAGNNMDGLLRANYGNQHYLRFCHEGLAESIQSNKSWVPLKIKRPMTFHLVVVTTFLS